MDEHLRRLRQQLPPDEVAMTPDSVLFYIRALERSQGYEGRFSPANIAYYVLDDSFYVSTGHHIGRDARRRVYEVEVADQRLFIVILEERKVGRPSPMSSLTDAILYCIPLHDLVLQSLEDSPPAHPDAEIQSLLEADWRRFVELLRDVKVEGYQYLLLDVSQLTRKDESSQEPWQPTGPASEAEAELMADVAFDLSCEICAGIEEPSCYCLEHPCRHHPHCEICAGIEEPSCYCLEHPCRHHPH